MARKTPAQIWPDIKAILEMERAGLLRTDVARNRCRQLMVRAGLPMARAGSVEDQLKRLLNTGKPG